MDQLAATKEGWGNAQAGDAQIAERVGRVAIARSYRPSKRLFRRNEPTVIREYLNGFG
jgi:hypothetical protein